MRLAHVLDSLALAIELGLGVPAQTIHRAAIVSARLGRGARIDEQDVVAAYYLAILCYVGCTTTSHETSKAVDELGLGGTSWSPPTRSSCPSWSGRWPRPCRHPEARAAARSMAEWSRKPRDGTAPPQPLRGG